MAKKLSVTEGVTAMTIPEDVRVKAVLFDGKRIPYRLTAERKLQLREPVTGVAEVSFEKIQTATVAVPIEAATYFPIPATPARAPHGG